MLSATRIGAGAVGAALASSALLASAGPASAQQGLECDPDAYPPRQCTVVGGANNSSPPLTVTVTIGKPGDRVETKATKACDPNTPVGLSIVRISTGAAPVRMGSAVSDAEGGFEIGGAVPSNAAPGAYVLYAACKNGEGVTVTTTSFVVESSAASLRSGSASTSAQRARSGSTTGDSGSAAQAAATVVAVQAVLPQSDVPAAWTPPADWAVDAATRTAVERAVNLKLAALRTALPPAEVPAPAGTATSGTDVNAVHAGAAGIAFLLLGVVGWRRRSSATTEAAL